MFYSIDNCLSFSLLYCYCLMTFPPDTFQREASFFVVVKMYSLSLFLKLYSAPSGQKVTCLQNEAGSSYSTKLLPNHLYVPAVCVCSVVNSVCACDVLFTESGWAVVVSWGSWRAEAAAPGFRLLRLHRSGRRTASLVLGLVSSSAEPMPALSQGRNRVNVLQTPLLTK